MPAYIIGEFEILDVAQAGVYGEKADPLLEKHGGRRLVASGHVRHLEGREPTRELAVLEFPSRAHAEAFWDDPEYQKVRELRREAVDIQLSVFDGL